MIENDLNKLYKICFNRSIDTDGLLTYKKLVDKGYDTEQIYTILFNSDECTRKYIVSEFKSMKILKITVVFHIGTMNINIIHEISRCITNIAYLCTVNEIIITSYFDRELLFEILPHELKNAKILIFENQGMDIGPFLKAIPNLDKSFDYVLKLHTKSNDTWRNKLLHDISSDIISAYFALKTLFEKKVGLMCSNDVLREYQGENKNTIFKFFETEFDIDVSSYYDQTKKNVQNEKLDSHFYRNYHSDLKEIIPESRIDEDARYHWENSGKFEHCRIPNESCIIKKKTKTLYFVAGTIFFVHKDILEHMQNHMNLNNIVEDMECNYVTNENETIVHSWEYIFSFYSKELLNMPIVGTQLKYYSNNTEQYKHFAVFLPEPPHNALCGGTRTILNFIRSLQDQKYLVDIFICFYPFKECDISVYKRYIQNFNILDKNDTLCVYNLFDFHTVNLKYKCLIATGWQTTNFVINFNKYNVKKVHFIQDDERKFHNKDTSFLEYGISEQAFKNHNAFDKKISITKCLSYILYKEFNSCISPISFGVNKNHYKHFNLERKYDVCLLYAPSKPRRLPDMIYEIIVLLKAHNLSYISYGEDIPNDTNKKFTKSLGCLDLKQLLKLYNTTKIGICLSDTNPSRIPFEMHECGMHVIEYDSIYTQWDVPFYKTKSAAHAIELIHKILQKQTVMSFKNRNQSEENKEIVSLLKTLLI